MRLNELLDDLKLNMTIYSFLGEIMSVIDCGEELNRAPPAYIDRIIRDAHEEVRFDYRRVRFDFSCFSCSQLQLNSVTTQKEVTSVKKK